MGSGSEAVADADAEQPRVHIDIGGDHRAERDPDDGPSGDPVAVPPQQDPGRAGHGHSRCHEAIEALAAVLGQLDWPQGTVQVFAHGERESMKAVRRVLFDERGLDRAHVSLSGYWARGRTEDRFQAEKREPIGKIL